MARADAAYRPFPSFRSWTSQGVDRKVWEPAVAEYEQERTRATEESRRAALEFATRAAAIDTGAIEGLYRVDRGFTVVVAAQGAMWESQIRERGADVRGHFEAQLEGLELVLDAVNGRAPLSEAWIRRLHEVLCRHQETYLVRTPQGDQRQALPKGQYKTHPNHVVLTDGSLHSYCPVDRTAAEMHRLVVELGNELFSNTHPVMQAAYAHYALVAVHPFADGNGRVARALASLFLYRALSLPLVIFADRQPEYWNALAEADAGKESVFVAFIFEQVVDTLRVLTWRLRQARTVPVEESLAALRALYVGPGNLPHQDVDAVAARVCHWLKEEFEGQLDAAGLPGSVTPAVALRNAPTEPRSPGYRRLVRPPESVVEVTLRSAAPASAKVQSRYHLVVSRRPEAHFAFVLEKLDSEDSLEIRLNEVDPEKSLAFAERLRSWSASEVADLTGRLSRAAADALKQAGY